MLPRARPRPRTLFAHELYVVPRHLLPAEGGLGMGASSWEYYVPFQPDLDSALQDLKERVLAGGDYYWPLDGQRCPFPDLRSPRPETLQQLDTLLAENEWLQSEGTHSILDMERVTDPGEDAEPRTVEPVSTKDLEELTGRDLLTRADVHMIAGLADERWFGRCIVLHDEQGDPSEIYFWGWSGD